jgi:hypothetical protein
LLEWITEALERLSPRQVKVVPMEGLAAKRTEVVLVVVADVEQAQTPLFLRDSDPVDMPLAGKDNEDHKDDLESSSGSEASGSSNGSFGTMDGDAMIE